MKKEDLENSIKLLRHILQLHVSKGIFYWLKRLMEIPDQKLRDEAEAVLTRTLHIALFLCEREAKGFPDVDQALAQERLRRIDYRIRAIMKLLPFIVGLLVYIAVLLTVTAIRLI